MNDKVHVRMCLGCRKMLHKSSLLRICLIENEISVDNTYKMGGRGAYICSAECLKQTEKARRLPKALKRAVSEQEYKKLYEELTLWNNQKN